MPRCCEAPFGSIRARPKSQTFTRYLRTPTVALSHSNQPSPSPGSSTHTGLNSCRKVGSVAHSRHYHLSWRHGQKGRKRGVTAMRHTGERSVVGKAGKKGKRNGRGGGYARSTSRLADLRSRCSTPSPWRKHIPRAASRTMASRRTHGCDSSSLQSFGHLLVSRLLVRR